MYRIPKVLDLSEIIGESTTQFLVGQYDLQFEFGNVYFTVQSPVKLTKQGELFAEWEEDKWPDKGFIEILNLTISEVSIPDDKTIIIKFENDLEMHLSDNSEQFECIQISINGKQWII